MGKPDLKELAQQAIERHRGAVGETRRLRELERRQTVVEKQLQANPQLRYAFDVQDAPLRPEPGNPVSVVLGVRTACGIVSSELRVPRDRFCPVTFFDTLEKQQ